MIQINEYTIQCNGCNKFLRTPDGSDIIYAKTIKVLEAHAGLQEWQIDGDRHICPACQESVTEVAKNEKPEVAAPSFNV